MDCRYYEEGFCKANPPVPELQNNGRYKWIQAEVEKGCHCRFYEIVELTARQKALAKKKAQRL